MAEPAHSKPNARPPLPAGHPESWGLITQGTCLDGVPWPGPAPGAQPQRGRPALDYRTRTEG